MKMKGSFQSREIDTLTYGTLIYKMVFWTDKNDSLKFERDSRVIYSSSTITAAIPAE